MGVESTLAGFSTWIRTGMSVPVDALADDSIYIPMAYWPAETLCNDWLYLVGNVEPSPQQQNTIRATAVYNLGGAILVQIAQDDPDLDPPWNTYWQDMRQRMGLNGFVSGVVQSASDQGTSTSYKVSSFFDNLTPTELQLMQSPWGRLYMSIASWYGPTIWGLT
jgi:hypothetical protein